MKSPLTKAVAGCLLVLVLLASDLIAPLGQFAPSNASANTRATPVDYVERTWEGGGSLLPFVDDMGTETAAYYAASAASLHGYHGGADAEPAPSPAAWRNDPYRWGQAYLFGARQTSAWRADDHFVQFGTGHGADSTYPASALVELVSPVIDLRGLAPQSEASTVAALRLRHAYGFDGVFVGGSFQPMDGGRVEASSYDSAERAWNDWTPLSPSGKSLRVTNTELEAQYVTGPIPFEARINASQTTANGRVWPPDNPQLAPAYDVEIDPNGNNEPVAAGSPAPPPYMYAGPVSASGFFDPRGQWDGFSGNSGAWVESVFDLSSFAQQRIRLRFVVATAESSLGTESSPGFGWAIDQLEVHAAGTSSLQVVDLVSPGNGARIQPTQETRAVAVIQNLAADPTTVEVGFRIGNATTHAQATAGAGPTGRSFVPSAQSLASLAPTPAAYVATVQARILTQAAQEATDLPAEAERSFHFGTFPALGLMVREANVRPLRTTPDGETTETSGRFLFENQDAQLVLVLENTGTATRTISAADSPIQPKVTDLAGTPIGQLIPITPATALQPGADVAGFLGTVNASREFAWRWTGAPSDGAYQFTAHDGLGATVFDAGTILVETIQPPAIDLNYTNRWNLEGECRRTREWEEAKGVIICQGEEAAITGGADFLVPITIASGDQTAIEVRYKGGPLRATMERIEQPIDPAGNKKPPTTGWSELGAANLAASPTEWRLATVQTGALPEGFTGWIRLHLHEFDAPTSIDMAATLLLLDRLEDGAPAKLHRVIGTFDVEATPKALILQASSNTGLAHLKGTSQQDAVLAIPGLIDLRGIIRPTLRFDHFHGVGTQSTAVVEVARTPIEPWNAAGPAPAPAHLVPTIGENDWQIIAKYTGTLLLEDLAAASVSLDSYVGSQVAIRFRYHSEGFTVAVKTNCPLQDTTCMLPHEVPPDEFGWYVQAVRVDGTDGSGTATLHKANEHFDNYPASSFSNVPRMKTATLQTSSWPTPTATQPEPTFANISPGAFPGASWQTEEADMGGMIQPVLTLRHSFAGKECHLIDIEYQVRRTEKPWPTLWSKALRANPGEVPLPDPDRRLPLGAPFASHADNEVFDDVSQSLDLASLLSRGDLVRFRFTVWALPSCSFQAMGSWTIHSIFLGERRHLTDANVGTPILSENDYPALAANAPGLVEDLALDEKPIVANDRLTVTIPIRNEGLVPITALATLFLTKIEASQSTVLDDRVFWIDPAAGAPSEGPVGTIEDLAPGQATELTYWVDLTKDSPGLYRLAASVESSLKVDTRPSNNNAQSDLRLLPFRDLHTPPSAATVIPFAAGPDDERIVTIKLQNRGNVYENNVHVEAEIVQMTSLTRFQSLSPTPIYLQPDWTGFVDRRAGEETITWRITGANFPAGSNAAALMPPGHRYAIRVVAHAQADSVLAWWNGAAGRVPITVGNQGGQTLSDATSPPAPHCGCLLIPFLAEQVVFDTDFSAENTTSLLGQGTAVDALRNAWTPTTLLDGQAVPADRHEIPRWQFIPNVADIPNAIQGTSSGGAWYLPPYDGRENLEQIIESPPLPANVISEHSRALLGLRYASSLEAGQAVVEVSQSTPTGWTDWKPIDELRSRRVAVVLAPDFPNVLAVNLSQPQNYVNYYANNQPAHPIPPFYTDPGDDPNILPVPDATCVTTSKTDRCRWTYFPHFPPDANPEWVAYLDAVLGRLGSEFGPENIAIYTTVTDDLGVPREANGENLLYRLASPTPAVADTLVPVRTLPRLGDEFDSYGAILLLGDNSTTTFAARSINLTRMSHGPADNTLPVVSPAGAADREPTEAALSHFENLTQVMRAAQASGIRVVAAAGPATATLALTGIATGQTIATWSVPGGITPAYKCTYPLVFTPGNLDWQFFQPRKACGTSLVPINLADPHNYRLYSPIDAQSLALADLIRAGGAIPASATAAMPISTRLGAENGGQGLLLVTDSGQNLDPNNWLDTIIAALATADGGLPVGNSRWGQLPADLAYPFGGTYVRTTSGDDFYIGTPTKVRIRVSALPSEPVSPGHGFFALDAAALLGTTRQAGLGVAFVTPIDGAAYAPGKPFTPVIEITNHGIEPTQAVTATLMIEQVFDPQDERQCLLLDGPTHIPVPVRSMIQGEVLRLRIEPPGSPLFFGGLFPTGPSCKSPHLQRNEFTFRISLPERPYDSFLLDDAATAMVIGSEIHELELIDFTVSPNQAPPSTPREIILKVENHGTQREPITYQVIAYNARPLPCSVFVSDQPTSCDPDGQPSAPRFQIDSDPRAPHSVDRDETVTLRLPLMLDREEILKVKAVVSAIQPDGTAIPGGAITRWIHVVTNSESPTGLSAAAEIVNARDVTDPTRPPLSVRGNGTHPGTWSPDSTTRDQSSGGVQALNHGWRVQAGCTGCADGAQNVIEWRRDGMQAWRPGTDSGRWSANQFPSPVARGMNDIGPDFLLWSARPAGADSVSGGNPNAGTDPTAPPYLTLASLEAPTFVMAARYEASDVTVLSVQMEVASRTCRVIQNARLCNWAWTENWFPLSAAGVTTPAPTSVTVPVQTQECQPNAAGIPQCTWFRHSDTNPLAGQIGIWGGSSMNDGPENEWRRLQFTISSSSQPGLLNYCRTLDAFPTQAQDFDACRYSAAVPGFPLGVAPIARPVRFRIAAASYGGDPGESFLQLRALGLTGHDTGFQGADNIQVSMTDVSEQLIPIRVANEGSVADRVVVEWRPPPGREGLLDATVDLSTSVRFQDPRQSLEVPVNPGQAKVVWVRVKTGLTENPPGAVRPIPFEVFVKSVVDSSVEDSAQVVATMRARAWPDVTVSAFVLNGDDDAKRSYRAAVGVPILPLVGLRNIGQGTVGSADAPLQVRVEVNVYGQPDPVHVAKALVTEPVRSFSSRAPDRFLRLTEWTPAAPGLYNITVYVNDPNLNIDHLLPLPERNENNNQRARSVLVGPVQIPDPQVLDAWVVPFDDGCQTQRVARVIALHAYCVAANITNVGAEPVLEPLVSFGVGADSPFSVNNLDGFFGDLDYFPPQESITVYSSPRTVQVRDASTATWNVYVDLSASTFLPNPERKFVPLDVPVDHFGLKIDAPAKPLNVRPGGTYLLALNLTNKGTAPITPQLLRSPSNETISIVAVQVPRLLPGERRPALFEVLVSRDASDATRTVALEFGSNEDDLIREKATVAVRVTPGEPPRAQAGKASTAVGTATIPLLLDNHAGSKAIQWRLAAVPDFLVVPTNLSLPTTQANSRALADITALIIPLAAPGARPGTITLHATDGSTTAVLRADITVDVPTDPRLRADLRSPKTPPLRGQVATLEVIAENAGNVPLQFRSVTETNTGSARTIQPETVFDLDVNQTRTLGIELHPGNASRSIGLVRIEWRAAAGPWLQSEPLPWTVDFASARVLILDAKAQVAPNLVKIAATIENPLDRTQEFEVLLYADSILVDRKLSNLGPKTKGTVEFVQPFLSPASSKTLLLVAHPSQTSADVSEPSFYEHGDARSLFVEAPMGPEEAAAKKAPGPAAIGLFLVFLLVAIWRRRK